LLLFEYVSDDFLGFDPSMTTSGFMQIAELVGRCMVCSGTVWNKKIWPVSLRDTSREDVSMEGQILIKQKQDFAAKRAHTFVAQDADAGNVLDTIAGQSDLKDFRALTDTGGIFRSSNGEPVSRKMRAWIRANNDNLGDGQKSDFQGLMFYQSHNERSGGACCIMNASLAIHVLPGTTKEDVLNAGCDLNKIAVYSDETRTAGTGVKFQPTGCALQTIDPDYTPLRDLPQGSMRMRQ
jgi:hypothetical protein